ncbi:uncharacterized protein LOC127100483 [Lathyrus oleraceus]|uniref:Thioredoxin-like fold domain-containing protein n=1 Tax=Pisum sativum TaxID=3888 RepID=A0A9D4ZVJ2_PEA|nr:uncharacterized protein LOC127100483 [Pisum sativum]KAI5385314.1 hypothetical protein KIW84_072060 [Pisum sativum]
MSGEHGSGILTVLSLLALQLQVLLVGGDYIPPAKSDGFVYKNRHFNFDAIQIEAFYDPLCPYSAESWPPLQTALDHYDARVSLVVHLLPLPYHDNAFVASRALHIVNGLDRSATFPVLKSFFKHQEKFYGAPTRNLSRASVVDEIVKFVTSVIGNSSETSIKNGFNDTNTDLLTRVSFKYAASRGVSGTPSFYVNGFVLPPADNTLNYSDWRNVIDPLIGVKKSM